MQKEKKNICHIQIFQLVKHRVTGGEATLEAWTNKKKYYAFHQAKQIHCNNWENNPWGVVKRKK